MELPFDQEGSWKFPQVFVVSGQWHTEAPKESHIQIQIIAIAIPAPNFYGSNPTKFYLRKKYPCVAGLSTRLEISTSMRFLLGRFFAPKILSASRILCEDPTRSCFHFNPRLTGVVSSSIPSRELTYPTLGKGQSSSTCHFWGILLVPWRVYPKAATRVLSVFYHCSSLSLVVSLSAVRATFCSGSPWWITRRSLPLPWAVLADASKMEANNPYKWPKINGQLG